MQTSELLLYFSAQPKKKTMLLGITRILEKDCTLVKKRLYKVKVNVIFSACLSVEQGMKLTVLHIGGQCSTTKLHPSAISSCSFETEFYQMHQADGTHSAACVNTKHVSL